MTPAFFALLLRDTMTFLQPRRVSILSPSTKDQTVEPSSDLASEPCLSTLLALSDLHTLFQPPPSYATSSNTDDERPLQSVTKSRREHVSPKLLFYAGQVLGMRSQLMEMLAAEAEARLKKFEEEGLKATHEAPAEGSAADSSRKPEGERKVLVEEIVCS